MIRLVVLDMDGTLLNSAHQISPGNKEALIRAMKAGIRVCLASGRNVASLMPFAKTLKLQKYCGFLIGGNGQELFDFKTNILEKRAKIPLSACRKIVRFALENQLELSGNDDLNKRYYYCPPGCKTKHKDIRSLHFNEQTQMLEDEKEIDKLGLYFPRDPEGLEAWIPRLTTLLGGLVEIHVVNPERIEFTALGINKVSRIRELCQREQYGEDEVLVIGDGLNDRQMIAAFTHSAAMGNAFEEVKALARYQCADHDEDGVAMMIERVLSGEIQ